jgi:hypothetical protein
MELESSGVSLSDTRFAGPAAQFRLHPPAGGKTPPFLFSSPDAAVNTEDASAPVQNLLLL